MPLRSIHSQPTDLPDPLPGKIHYACGRNVLSGWLNVDGFDVTYPLGTVDQELATGIYQADLTREHPFPEGHFRFGYAEDFLEHLSQAESLVFLSECYRTLRPGGVLRLSFPGLRGVLDFCFKTTVHQEVLQGVHDAYTVWSHEHFYCEETIELVARHLGFSEVAHRAYGESPHPELAGLETRPNQTFFNLFVELTK